MTGGALGSICAQFLHLTADERKTLLVAGAAAGMAATFNAPLASVLLAVELLLFEWRPRSFIPVVAAVAVATIVRVPLLGSGAVFPAPAGAAAPRRRRLRALRRSPASSPACWRCSRRPWSTSPRTPSSGCRSTGCGGRRSAA